MSKRLIGIEIGDRTLRVAILNQNKGQISVSSLQARNFADPAELTGQLRRSWLVSSGSEISWLPACRPAAPMCGAWNSLSGMKRKSLRPSLSTCPASCRLRSIIVSRRYSTRQTDKGATVATATVPTETLQSLLSLFEQADVPLHLVDLAPFCYVAGLGEQIGDGILICATDQETTVSLVQNGLLVDYRILPTVAGPSSGCAAPAVTQGNQGPEACRGSRRLDNQPDGRENHNRAGRISAGSEPDVEILSLELGGELVDGAFLPAVALALRGKITKIRSIF